MSDVHAREYAGAVAGMAEVYGRREIHAVGDTIWIRQPDTHNTRLQAVVLDHLEDGQLHVSVHTPGCGRQHYFVSHEDVLPF